MLHNHTLVNINSQAANAIFHSQYEHSKHSTRDIIKLHNTTSINTLTLSGLFWTRNWSHIAAYLVVGATSSKESLNLCRFKSDPDKIWHDCSSSHFTQQSAATWWVLMQLHITVPPLLYNNTNVIIIKQTFIYRNRHLQENQNRSGLQIEVAYRIAYKSV